jgi:uncharacterized membrane protein
MAEVSRPQRVLEPHFRLWRERGLLAPGQEEALRAASAEAEASGTSTVVRTALALLGGGLVLAGLLLVIAENWDALHRGVKLAGWGVLLVVFLVAAHEAARRFPDRIFFAEAFALIAGGWVLGGIALVSQIYHLNSRPPNGVWLWLALLVPAVALLRRRGITAAVWVALIAGLALEAAEPGSWIHAADAESPWLWLAVPLLAAFLVSWLPARLESLPEWTGTWLFAAGTVFLLVFGAFQELDDAHLGGAWAVAGAGLAAALAFPDRCLPRTWGATTSRLVLAGTLLPWVLSGRRYEAGDALDLAAVGVAWVAQIAVAVLVIRAGAKSDSKFWVNLGYLAVLAGILTRYFDLFGDFLEGGLALALTGLLILFVLFALERARRRTLRQPAPEAVATASGETGP